MHEQQGRLNGHTHVSLLKINGTAIFTILCCFMIRVRNIFLKNEYHADFWIASETSFLIMKWVRNVFPKFDLWAKRLSEMWFGCETSFSNRVWVRNVFLKYGLGAKRLSEIWFGCETSSWIMKTGAKRLSYLWGGGETSLLSVSWGRNVSLKNVANWLWGEKSVYRVTRAASQQERDVDPLLGYFWPTVHAAWPTFAQHWVDVPCLLGYHHLRAIGHIMRYLDQQSTKQLVYVLVISRLAFYNSPYKNS